MIAWRTITILIPLREGITASASLTESWLCRRDLAAFGTLSPALILHPLIDDWLQLRVQVGAVERDFFDEDEFRLGMRRRGAIPPHRICRVQRMS